MGFYWLLFMWVTNSFRKFPFYYCLQHAIFKMLLFFIYIVVRLLRNLEKIIGFTSVRLNEVKYTRINFEKIIKHFCWYVDNLILPRDEYTYLNHLAHVKKVKDNSAFLKWFLEVIFMVSLSYTFAVMLVIRRYAWIPQFALQDFHRHFLFKVSDYFGF